MEMTNAEIAANYRQSKDRRMQIGILAELNACSRAEIETILLEQGITIPQKTKSVGNCVIARIKQLKGQESSAWIAQKVGVKPAKMRRWLSGENTPSLDGLVAIAVAFNVSTDWLLGLEGKE